MVGLVHAVVAHQLCVCLLGDIKFVETQGAGRIATDGLLQQGIEGFAIGAGGHSFESSGATEIGDCGWCGLACQHRPAGAGEVGEEAVYPEINEGAELVASVAFVGGRQEEGIITEGIEMNIQTGFVGICHQACGAAYDSVCIADLAVFIGVIPLAVAVGINKAHRQDAPFVGADAIGIGLDFSQPFGGGEIGIGARVVGEDKVIGPATAAKELNQGQVNASGRHDAAVKLLEIAHFKGLKNHPGGVCESSGFECVDENLAGVLVDGCDAIRQLAIAEEEAGVFGFGVDADFPARFRLHLLHKGNDLVQGGDLETVAIVFGAP